jgi:hypothetical protein
MMAGPMPGLLRNWLSGSQNKAARLRWQTGGLVAVRLYGGAPPEASTFNQVCFNQAWG